jgi:creatinine amidohydrolase
LEYAGSCSVARQTFKAFMAELVDSILHTGAPKVFLINTGVSTIAPLDELARSPSYKDGLFLFHCALGPEYGNVSKTLAVQPFGGTHADELETSLMLHIAPGVVNMSAAVASPNAAPMQPGPLHAKDMRHPNYSPSGVCGDPTLASAEKGSKLAQARRKDLQDAMTACLVSRGDNAG